MKRVTILLGVLLLLFVLVPTSAAYASPSFDRIIGEGETVHEDVVVFGGNLAIKKGATVDGDVSVFGGNATLAGHIEGDVAVFGGVVDLSGTVDGDLVVLGGVLDAGASAEIDGDCILVGGNLSGDGASGLNCSEVGEFPGLVFPSVIDPISPPSLPSPPSSPKPPTAPTPPSPPVSGGRGFFGTVSAVAGRSLFLGLLALVAGYLAPNQLNQVNDTLRQKPAASGVVGVLTAIAIPSLLVLLVLLTAVLIFVCIGLLGIPIIIALVLAFGLAILMGWISAGTILGQGLARWLKMSNRTLPVLAALGTAALTLALGLLGELPFWLGSWFWGLAGVLIACAGLGAVALTRFGTRPYPPMAPVANEKVDSVLETLPVEDGDHEVPGKSPYDEG